MCYYNEQNLTKNQIISLNNFELRFDFEQENEGIIQKGFDHLQAVVIKNTSGQNPELTQMEWGFLPSYLQTKSAVDQFRKGYKNQTGKFIPPIITLNAIGEELLKPNKIFRNAALQNRCIIPSTAFYEWKHSYPTGKKGLPLKTAIRQPYRIFPKHHPLFFLAGIWTPWVDKQTGQYAETFAIVTTQANALMEQIHNTKKRMPLILSEQLAHTWLQQNLSEHDIDQITKYVFPETLMDATALEKNFLSGQAII